MPHLHAVSDLHGEPRDNPIAVKPEPTRDGQNIILKNRSQWLGRVCSVECASRIAEIFWGDVKLLALYPLQ